MYRFIYGTLSLQDSTPVQSNCTNYEVRFEPNNSTNQNRGKVQICFNGVWGVVCSNGVNSRSFEGLCNQLGHQRRGIIFLFMHTFANLDSGEYIQGIHHLRLHMNPVIW